MQMNRNMMIGGIVAIVVIVIVVVVLLMGGGDDDGGEVTSESVTNAFEEMLAGNTEPAKAISCEEDQEGIDEAAAEMGQALEEEGAEVSVACNVDGDAGSCDLTISMEVEGQDEPFEVSQTMDFTIVDGKICGGLEATQ